MTKIVEGQFSALALITGGVRRAGVVGGSGLNDRLSLPLMKRHARDRGLAGEIVEEKYTPKGDGYIIETRTIGTTAGTDS